MRKLAALAAVVSLSATLALVPAGTAEAARPATFEAGLWPYAKLDIAALHQQSTGAGVTIAVIDGPVDPSVPELRGQRVITQSKGYCQAPDGSFPATGSGSQAAHATSITSLIVGNGHGNYQGRGVQGVAPGATVRAYTAGFENSSHDVTCTAPGSYSDHQQALAVDQAVKDGAKIINVSFGASTPQVNELGFALGLAEKAGAIVVVATDDHTTPGAVNAPATTNGAIAVNAVDSAGVLAKSSAGGNLVSIAAPGTGLTIGTFGPDWQSSGWGDGSSYAAPIVCGALALVWSKYPKATANQVIQDLLTNTGLIVGKDASGKATYTNGFTRSADAPPGYQQGNGYGYGIVNPAAMLAHDPSRYPNVNPLVRADGTPAPNLVGASAAPSTSAPGGGSFTQSATVSPSSRPATGQAAASSGGGSSALPVIIGVLVVLALVAGGVVLLVRRRSSAGPAASG